MEGVDGCSKLMGHLIVSALKDFWGESNKKLEMEAKDWIDGAYSAITFEDCCVGLDIDVTCMRKIIADGKRSFGGKPEWRDHEIFHWNAVEW